MYLRLNGHIFPLHGYFPFFWGHLLCAPALAYALVCACSHLCKTLLYSFVQYCFPTGAFSQTQRTCGLTALLDGSLVLSFKSSSFVSYMYGFNAYYKIIIKLSTKGLV